MTILTDQTFDKAYEAHNKAEMVEFFATWCPHCKKMEPVVAKLAQEYADKISILTVDVDQAPLASRKFSISGVPTFLFVKNGKVVESLAGEYTEGELKEQLKALL